MAIHLAKTASWSLLTAVALLGGLVLQPNLSAEPAPERPGTKGNGAWEYHSSMKLILSSEKKPLRIFTHVSENDLRAKDPESTQHNWVMAGQRTEAALQEKGYDHRFVFSRATGHCDRKVFEQTLADTLVWIWRGYVAG